MLISRVKSLLWCLILVVVGTVAGWYLEVLYSYLKGVIFMH